MSQHSGDRRRALRQPRRLGRRARGAGLRAGGHGFPEVEDGDRTQRRGRRLIR
ncbi:hypothetical protein PAI11_10100 [Patulibacter medicamentivorans]|uniref:Uncharacterized protein n=1 Tax=Patulibacter medicamentivorans TaxID=1097667 RepID=H0E2J7_9ACTN|nr:hypothetical protein PAI11_10100 [Patulibacter medicamentivorans]